MGEFDFLLGVVVQVFLGLVDTVMESLLVHNLEVVADMQVHFHIVRIAGIAGIAVHNSAVAELQICAVDMLTGIFVFRSVY